jgi:hypothetical protein
MDYILNDIGALERLKREKMLKHGIRRIVSPLQEKQLNRYYFACGCREGAIGVYLSLFCFGLFWWRNGFVGISAWWVLVIAAVASFIGKISGLVLSRYRLRKVYRELEIYFRGA